MSKSRAAGTEYLEGLDIRDPEFERWLRDRRLAVANTEPEPLTAPRSVRAESPTSQALPKLFLSLGNENGGGFLARHMLTTIGKGVSDRGSTLVVELETREQPVEQHGCFLTASERRQSDGTAVSLNLQSLETGRTIWSSLSMITPEAANTLPNAVAPEVSRAIDHVAVETALSARDQGKLFPTVHEMFQTLGRDFASIGVRLEKCFEAEPRGVILAWQSFLRCYVYGEQLGPNADTVKDEARELALRSMEMEPNNPLVLSLASHVHTFLLDQPTVGLELSTRAINLDGTNLFGWASSGYAKLANGDASAAYDDLSRARQMMGEGPQRFMIDFLFGLAAMMSGRLSEGTATLETVHALKPDYLPPLRYLLAGYLASGDYGNVERSVLRLQELEPGFEIAKFAESDYPTPALRRFPLLDLGNLPKLL